MTAKDLVEKLSHIAPETEIYKLLAEYDRRDFKKKETIVSLVGRQI